MPCDTFHEKIDLFGFRTLLYMTVMVKVLSSTSTGKVLLLNGSRVCQVFFNPLLDTLADELAVLRRTFWILGEHFKGVLYSILGPDLLGITVAV